MVIGAALVDSIKSIDQNLCDEFDIEGINKELFLTRK